MTNISQIFEQAVSFIQQKDPKSLNLLIQKNPQLLQDSDSDGSNQTLIHHTLSYANFAGDDPSLWSTPECADVLWKNGALIDTKFVLRALSTADLPMVEWLSRKNELPGCIRGFAALDKTRELKGWFAKGKLQPNAVPPVAWLRETSDPLHHMWKVQNYQLTDDWLITDAFRYAIRFGHKCTAGLLLEQVVEINSELAQRVKETTKTAFLDYLVQHRSDISMTETLPIWEMLQLVKAKVAIVNADIDSFQSVLETTPSLLKQQYVKQQIELLELAAYSDGYVFAKLLLNSGAYISRANPRPKSKALVYAIDYGNREMVGLLKKLWEPPYNLPTLAGLGDLSKVKTYPNRHIDEADLVGGLALACMNQHQEVADYLIQQGADVNAEWSLHEPATILHHLAFFGKLNMVRFLIERGANPTIKDFRYQSDALGWAKYNDQDQVAAYLQQVMSEKINH
jgi:ankyrin repeat protein